MNTGQHLGFFSAMKSIIFSGNKKNTSANVEENQEILRTLEKVIDMCGDKKIKSITPMSKRCDGCCPCNGHQGVVIHVEDMEYPYEFDCSTIEIGVIMNHFGFTSKHFSQYVSYDLMMYIHEEINL